MRSRLSGVPQVRWVQAIRRGILAVAAGLICTACSPTEGAPASARLAPSPAPEEAARIAAIVDPVIAADLAQSGIPGAAFVFVRGGRIVYQQGYGFSDLRTGERADPERTVWPVASITKTVTALAALRLVEQGRVDLDADVNAYLRRLQVPSQGYGPLTLRHLLSHTGGLDELPGRQFVGNDPPDMAAFIKDRIVRYRPPGERTAYGTYGIWLAGILVEDVAREEYADYVRRHVFAPAGMTHARIMAAPGDERGVAVPYRIEDGRAEPVPHEWYVSTPTSSMAATAGDMGRLLLAFLGHARPGAKPILSRRLLQATQSQQATVHPDIPGWGLGLQLDRVNGRRLAEHGGDIAGFSALLTLVPDENAGFFIVHHGDSGNLRFRVKQALLDGLYPAMPPPVPSPDPADRATLGDYAGSYISSLACRTCAGDEGEAFQVAAEPDGTLSLWGQKWVKVGRDLFIRLDGKRLIGFARDPQGRVVAVSGGSWRVADRLITP